MPTRKMRETKATAEALAKSCASVPSAAIVAWTDILCLLYGSIIVSIIQSNQSRRMRTFIAVLQKINASSL